MPDDPPREVPSPAPVEPAKGPSDEARRRIGVRVLLVLGVVVAILMVVFGQATAAGYDQFEAYKAATLDDPEHPPRWLDEQLTVEACVDEVLDWVEDCPGVSSWCEGSLPDVMNQCLDSKDRVDYCKAVGSMVRSTRFGFAQCSTRYDQIEGHYARRYAKKHCSILFRVVAGRCSNSAY